MSSVDPNTVQMERPPLDDRPVRNAAPAWTTGVVIAALVLALVGIGIGVYALSKSKAAGPTGAQGARGPQGPQGKQGPSGTIAATTITRGASQTSSPDPQPGTVLQATTSCPSGQILVGGGAQVSAPGVTADRNVTLRSSFPVNTTSWETVALVTGPLGPGVSMTMTPYVLCGQPAGSGAGSTSTTAP